MKHIKIAIAAIMVMLSLPGCDKNDGESLNTSNVSVGFGETALSLKETVSYITIPIVVNNDIPRDGDIVVTATMKSNTGGFQLDKDIIITTETLRIPAELNQINFEVGLHVNTPGLDRGRNVEFAITSVKGASIGDNNSCLIEFVETNFVEGTYNVEGVNLINGGIARGTIWMIADDDSLDNVRMNFGIGTSAKVDFKEITPEREYEIEIAPFQLIGVYYTYNVYLTWATMKKEETNPETVEVVRQVYYDRTKPLTGKFTCEMDDDGVLVNQKIVIKDSYALLGILNNSYAWFDSYEAGAVMTIED